MQQSTFNFPLTDFEDITARYFSEGKKPTKKHINLAIKKCFEWMGFKGHEITPETLIKVFKDVSQMIGKVEVEH